MPFQPYEPTPPLVFPVNGKEYTVVAINERDFAEGLRWQQIFAGDQPEPPNADQPRLVLGPVFDEMVTDGVPISAIARASFAVLTDYQLGREAAEKAWESGIDPEALAAAVAATQRESSQASQPSPSTASGNRTQRRAVSKRTTSRTTSKAARAKDSQS